MHVDCIYSTCGRKSYNSINHSIAKKFGWYLCCYSWNSKRLYCADELQHALQYNCTFIRLNVLQSTNKWLAHERTHCIVYMNVLYSQNSVIRDFISDCQEPNNVRLVLSEVCNYSTGRANMYKPTACIVYVIRIPYILTIHEANGTDHIQRDQVTDFDWNLQWILLVTWC